MIVPDTAKEKSVEGKVVSVGKGKILENGTLRPLDVKKGYRVLFGKYAGTEITINENEYLILSDDDIFGVIQ